MNTLELNIPKAQELVKKKRLAYIEGVRGMAAFMVVIHHYLLAFYPAQANGRLDEVHLNYIELWYYKSPFVFLTNGQFFVFLFFILSGFVLSRKFVLEKDINYLSSAFIRRFPRLYIPVAFSLIVGFILLKFSLDFNSDVSTITKSFWFSTLNGNPSIINFLESLGLKAMFSGDNSYNTVLWTISIELFGSLLVFATLALTYKLKNSAWIFLVIFTLLVLYNKAEYSSFILGILLNFLIDFEFKNKILSKVVIIFLLIFGLFLGGFPHVYYTITPTIKGTFYEFLNYPYIINKSGLINEFGAFFLILSVQQSSKLQNFFSSKLLAFFGVISFSLYLIHTLILQSFSSYIFLILIKYFSYNISFLIEFIVSIILIGIVSYLMTIYVDNKSVKASQFIYNKYFR